MITLIAAHDRNRAIGKDGGIPWHIPEDLALFKRETLGGAIVMGRKTWESLPFKPLKDRLNIVVSRDTSLAEHVAGSVEDAIALAQSKGYFRIYGIGGQGIYEAMLPLADRLLITHVDVEVEGADAWFPEVGEGWTEVGRAEIVKIEHNAQTFEALRLKWDARS
ncbi:dihydrofolate reductase [Sagittula salina]|uniref:Dihydrofolate reductase n=1 Tax=Sagittula salina TaxID=2820268 RepID=A0A940MRX6_9RHOB|nr:dihydrofolate reductase [Sagittula salina]MBP0483578.1 dihydrofolate reductase [Sagittula salina]